MLVVDRRFDLTDYPPGADRAEVQAELERRPLDHGATALPVQVELELPDNTQENRPGVVCIIETPGPEVLLQIILERVWGVSENRRD